ncbi:hypothetical protein GCM10027020_33560 [Nocardioides salsibiostraticola]
MSFLLRVELPNVPGSLGRLASAIGEVGGDIEAIEIVEKRPDGTVLDDVMFKLAPGTLPDSVVSACQALDGVHVVWVSRYAAGANLVLDLEGVEELTLAPTEALTRLVDLLPDIFRVHWAAHVHRSTGVVYATDAAPSDLEFTEITRAKRLDAVDGDVAVYAAARLDGNQIIIVGRRGGPEFVDSEVARLGHLCGVAAQIARI